MGYHIGLLHIQVLVLLFISNGSFALSREGQRFMDALAPVHKRCFVMQIDEADLRNLLGLNTLPPYPIPPDPVPYPFPIFRDPQSVLKTLSIQSLISQYRHFPPSRYPIPLNSQDPPTIRWNQLQILGQLLEKQPPTRREWPDLMLKPHLQRGSQPSMRREWPDLMLKPAHLQRGNQPPISREWPDLMLKPAHLQRGNQPPISREWPDLMLKPAHLQRGNQPPISREWPDLMLKPHLQRGSQPPVSTFRTQRFAFQSRSPQSPLLYHR